MRDYMNSNHYPGAYGYRPQPYGQSYGYGGGYRQPDPRPPEDTLRSSELQAERKYFTFTLKENQRGRFLRISEAKANYFQSIIIPATGLKEFQKILTEMVEEEQKRAAAKPEATPPAAS